MATAIPIEDQTRRYRPRQLVLHVTESTYLAVQNRANERGVSMATILRELFNKGAEAERAELAA